MTNIYQMSDKDLMLLMLDLKQGMQACAINENDSSRTYYQSALFENSNTIMYTSSNAANNAEDVYGKKYTAIDRYVDRLIALTETNLSDSKSKDLSTNSANDIL